ncbi:hypothetical protein PR048_026437 [Dryococelus australis]|uniref:Transposable element P transposase-like RNase H domain-containing protein n=1 Tax=Dryococelus australis TaxID=614101 RepID=A0ABQ9GLA7_9NEOP|nr:hypothetical protein PR048_026437 [Dryococelus australis]
MLYENSRDESVSSGNFPMAPQPSTSAEDGSKKAVSDPDVTEPSNESTKSPDIAANSKVAPRISKFTKQLRTKHSDRKRSDGEIKLTLNSIQLIYWYTWKIILKKVPFTLLKMGINHRTEKSRIDEQLRENCVLIFDEMSINEWFSCDVKNDMQEGMQDLGCLERSEEMATQALIIFFKIPVAYSLCPGPVKYGSLLLLLGMVVITMFKIGLNIKAAVYDQISTNEKVFEIL